MIISWLTGGLGNQMFQYAAGLALAEKHRTVLKLDVSWFQSYREYEAHNRYALSCLNITEQFATQEEIDRVGGFSTTRTERWATKLARALRLRRLAAAGSGKGRRFYPAAEGRYQADFEQLSDNTYIAGMWQSERYFASIAPLLRLHFSFRYPAPASVNAVAEQIRSGSSVAVHFRRGDYLRNPAFQQTMGVVGYEYYHRAIAQLQAELPAFTVYIFSDDIDTIEREFRPTVPHVFVRATQPWHAYDKIRLMSLCEHAVISNSTFAWWGAWLNPNPQKIVIAPDPWLVGKPDECVDTIPTTWRRLGRN